MTKKQGSDEAQSDHTHIFICVRDRRCCPVPNFNFLGACVVQRWRKRRYDFRTGDINGRQIA